MKKTTLFLAMLSFSWAVFAQQDGSTLEQPLLPPLETPWVQEDVGEFSDPISYVHQRQADVVYAYTIWRKLDLRERMNHPLYFPTEARGTWRSLAKVIFDAVDVENIENENALPIYEDEFCMQVKPRSSINDIFFNTKPIQVFDEVSLEAIGTREINDPFKPSDVYIYYFKEVWFFDKKRSLQDVRILQIEPRFEVEKERPQNQYEDQQQNEEDNVDLPRIERRIGVIKYDELRPYLAKQEVYNPKNFAQRLSLDDLLTWKRMFSSYIIAENNTYSDRKIADYIINARDQMIESDKITNKIREREHDLWEF